MTNEQIILNEAAKLDPATLHAIDLLIFFHLLKFRPSPTFSEACLRIRQL